MPAESQSAQSEPRKAYYATLIGRLDRDFLIYANTVEEAAEIMRGDRSKATALDDTFAEIRVTRPRRAPSEDRDA